MDLSIEQNISRIVNAVDAKLMHEAVLCLNAGANRAAYIMVWLACAESLKRKLRVAAEKDSNAGKLMGKIDEAEEKHHAVDKLLLDSALDYGLIADVELVKLKQIYENRCLYGHPYAIDPTNADCESALFYVVEFVLSRPDKLRHKYIEWVVRQLLTDEAYIDDDATKIAEYAKTVASRVDAQLHGYLFGKYLEGLSLIDDDPEKRNLRNRGRLFCKGYLEVVGPDKIVPAEDWHDLLAKYPRLVSWFAGWSSIFPALSERAQDSAVSRNLQYSKGSVERLNRLVDMKRRGILTQSQGGKVSEHCEALPAHKLRDVDVTLSDVYKASLTKLRSNDFDVANTGVNIFFVYKVESLNTLSENQLSEVGGALCDAAFMNAFDAMDVVSKIADMKLVVPEALRVGFCRRFFSCRVGDALSRKKLCRDSISVLFHLPPEKWQMIDDEFTKLLASDENLNARMQLPDAKEFVSAYMVLRPPIVGSADALSIDAAALRESKSVGSISGDLSDYVF